DQLVEQIRQAIARGRIARGARLPSSRNLADQLGISRNTVVNAYESLIIEGHAEARPASGIFVAAQTPGTLVPGTPDSPVSNRPPASPATPAVDPELKRLVGRRERRMLVDFGLDQGNPAAFPLKMWRRLVQAHLSHGAASNFAVAGDPAGAPE